MFDNIGKKIKTLASVITWIGIVCSIITGIILMFTSEKYILLGFLTAIVGSVASWIGSFLLYGFGELVENSAIIAKKSNINIIKPSVSGTVKQEESANQTTQDKTISLHKWKGKCQMCDKDNVNITEAVIVDDLGKRYRNVCEDCFVKYNCTPKNNQ